MYWLRHKCNNREVCCGTGSRTRDNTDHERVGRSAQTPNKLQRCWQRKGLVSKIKTCGNLKQFAFKQYLWNKGSFDVDFSKTLIFCVRQIHTTPSKLCHRSLKKIAVKRTTNIKLMSKQMETHKNRKRQNLEQQKHSNLCSSPWDSTGCTNSRFHGGLYQAWHH